MNPEVGLHIKGTPHVLKLYFKEEDLTKNRATLISHMMEQTLRSQTPNGTVFGVLHVRKSKVHTPAVPGAGLTALLRAEATCFVTMYKQL